MDYHVFAVVGGDKRQHGVIDAIRGVGYEARSYALGRKDDMQSLEETLTGADFVVLPIPVTRGGERIYVPQSHHDIPYSELLANLDERQIIFGGGIKSPLSGLLGDRGIKFHDILDRDDLAVANAIPTAEGAIELAMRESEITIHGSKSLVIGYGRVGKLMAKTLVALGSSTTVAARKDIDLALSKAYGCGSVRVDAMEDAAAEADFIFNTVPKRVITKSHILRMKPNAIIIDLASAPGGTDFEAAEKFGISAHLALALPGKVAPITAGRIIKDTIFSIIEQEGH